MYYTSSIHSENSLDMDDEIEVVRGRWGLRQSSKEAAAPLSGSPASPRGGCIGWSKCKLSHDI